MDSSPVDIDKRNRRVLVIDDNPSIHDDFRKILSPGATTRPALDAAETALFGKPTNVVRQTQFEVDSAYQGQEGVLLVKKAIEEGHPYAMAFMDVRMPPGMDGIETTQKLWEVDPNVQIVICTAFSDYSWDALFQTIGNCDRMVILKKPFDTVEVLQLAHVLTEKWWLHKQFVRKIEGLENMVSERTIEVRRTNEALQVDIAERERVEKALRESEERYHSLYKDSRDAIIILSPERGFIAGNPASIKLFACKDEQDFISRTPASLFPEYQEDSARSMDRYREMIRLALEEGSQFFEWTFRRADRTDFPATVLLSRLETSGAQLLQATVRDITKQKRLEEYLVKANKELQTALHQVRQNQALMLREERLSALGQMASGIAHDFNNVLMPIMGYSEMLLSQPETLNNRDEAIAWLRQINDAAQDAKKINHRLRLIQGTEEDGEYVPVDMNEIVKATVELTRPRWAEEMGAKGNHVNVVTPLEADKRAMGDASELREVLTNLVLNAVDAMPNGGTLTISSRVEDEDVVVEVCDTGTGMTAEAKARLLEPFFTTKGDKGTGLGLSMVHGILTRHNGTMKIDSTLGRGTTVKIRLPCAPAESGDAKPDDGTSETNLAIAPLRILVADDEANSRHLLVRMLKRDGHTIERVRTGREAINMAKTGVFDLVITDRSMPEVNGDMVAISVKVHSPETPVILLTGFGDIMKGAGECPEGVDMVLSKPITRNDLQRAVAEVMAGRREVEGGRGKAE
jgi:two-component system, cell cycle sensor histidine kinase and response regulator CckA